MKSNRVATLFGIRYPIVQGGMVWCSGWRLASAVSNAGGLGLIGAGSMTIEEFRTHVDRCQAATRQPFGVNIPLAIDAAPYVEYIIEKRVPVVFTSAGSPKLWTHKLQQRGVCVAHVVPSVKLALKCQDAGVNAVVAEGFEAGGHNGFEEITTMTLIPQVRQHLSADLPLLAAGGIGSGQAMLAAMALGADGVQIGTRFALTQESSAAPAFKQRCVEAKEGETCLSLRNWMPTRMLLNTYGKAITKLCREGATKEELQKFRGRGRTRRGIFEGDLEQGELEIGQIVSAMDDVPTVQEVFDRLMGEYQTSYDALQRLGA